MWIKSEEFKRVYAYLNAVMLADLTSRVPNSSDYYHHSYQPILDKYWADRLIVLSGNSKTDVYRVSINKWPMNENSFYVVSDSMEAVCTFMRELRGTGFCVAQTGKTFEEVYENV